LRPPDAAEYTLVFIAPITPSNSKNWDLSDAGNSPGPVPTIGIHKTGTANGKPTPDNCISFSWNRNCNDKHRTRQEDGMRGFLFGLGMGIGLGILFAPMSGEETRNNLADRATDLASSARDTYEQGRDRVNRGVESIRGTAERAMGQVRAGVNEGMRATGTEGGSPSPSGV
jgi:gas vesicle protein